MTVSKGTVLRFCIGLAVLILVIWFSQPLALLEVISGAAWEWLIIAVGIHIVATGATALRIVFLMERIDLFGSVFKANLAGMILADTTPGRAGYFATPLIVSKVCPELRKGRVLNVMFFGQIFDFLLRGVLLGGAILVVFYAIGATLNLYIYGALSLALVIALTAGFAALAYNKIPKPLVKIIGRIPSISRLYLQYSTYAESSDYSPRKAAGAFAITVLGWFLTALRWMAVGTALGLDIPVEWYLFVFPALTAVSFIPVSLAGLGIVEGGFALVFFVLGRSVQSGVAFALIDRAVALAGDLFGLPYVSRVGEGLHDLGRLAESKPTEKETP